MWLDTRRHWNYVSVSGNTDSALPHGLCQYYVRSLMLLGILPKSLGHLIIWGFLFCLLKEEACDIAIGCTHQEQKDQYSFISRTRFLLLTCCKASFFAPPSLFPSSQDFCSSSSKTVNRCSLLLAQMWGKAKRTAIHKAFGPGWKLPNSKGCFPCSHSAQCSQAATVSKRDSGNDYFAE